MLRTVATVVATLRIHLGRTRHGHPTLAQLHNLTHKAQQGEERLARPQNLRHVHRIQMFHIGRRSNLRLQLHAELFGILYISRVRTPRRNGVLLIAVRMFTNKRAARNHLESARRHKSVKFLQSLFVCTVSVHNHNHCRSPFVRTYVLHTLQCQRSHMASVHRHRKHGKSLTRNRQRFLRLQRHVCHSHTLDTRSTDNRFGHPSGCACRRKSYLINVLYIHLQNNL
ncbi:unknown [Bacteroides sp. CAG:633]|nr:unknown [Bacteroides sp. CAG:633]